jgi:hypothetical protein
MIVILFCIALVVGFIFWLMATWPVTYAERIARSFFLLASVILAYMLLSGGGVAK